VSTVASGRFRLLLVGDPVVHPGGGGEQRFIRAGVTGATSSIAKAIALGCTLAIAPITFRYLGAERFGLWMTITSLLLFVTFTDLGVGCGLTTAISGALGRQNYSETRQNISCAFWMLTGLACLLALLFFFIFPYIPWVSVYGVRSPLAIEEAGPATAVLLLCTAANMPLGTVARVQMGYQRAFVTDFWTAAGSVLGLFGVLVTVHLGGGLAWLVLSFAGSGVLVAALNCIFEFGIRRPELRPTFSLFSIRDSVQLGSIGFLFLIQQICGLVYYVSDNLVIARLLGPIEVGRFSMVQKLFSAGLVAPLFLNPLWPAFGEAIARGDYDWARKALARVRGTSVALGGVCGFGILVVSKPILNHWMGQQAHSLGTIRIAFAFWVVLASYVAGMNSALNHPGLMVKHLWLFGAAAFAALFLKFRLAPAYGISGVVWSTIIAFGTIYVLPAGLLAESSFRRGSTREKKNSGMSGVKISVSAGPEELLTSKEIYPALGNETPTTLV
jgi:O-antigen/teichoic acid export membrane protein